MILTGASSGLGRSLALKLLANGYRVALVSRNETELNKVKLTAGKNGENARIFTADLTDLASLNGLVQKCLDSLGTPHTLHHFVHCAGYSVTGRVEDIAAAEFERCVRVNFLSAVELIQQALPAMKNSGRSAITLVGSGAAKRALPYVSPYCVAKAALHSYAESARVELKPQGVRLLLFSPGPIQSNFRAATIHLGNTQIVEPPFHGKDPNWIANKMMAAMESNQERVLIGMRANLAHHLNYWMPKFTDRLVSRMYRISVREA